MQERDSLLTLEGMLLMDKREYTLRRFVADNIFIILKL
jgi:hypothetical protein